MTTTSASTDATSGNTRGGKGWWLLAAALAVLALVLSSLAITEVTWAVSLLGARSSGTEGVFTLKDCRTHADGFDPRPDYATCDGVFVADGPSLGMRTTVTVRRPDRTRPAEGWFDGYRGWVDDVSSPVAVVTAVAILLLALSGWAGAIYAYRRGGGRRRRRAGSPA